MTVDSREGGGPDSPGGSSGHRPGHAGGGGRRSWARRLGRDLLEFFLPGSCLGCGERVPVDRWSSRVCRRCLARLRPPSPPLCERCGIPLGTRPPRTDACEECRGWPEVLVRARSAAVLAEPADRLVHGLKYGGWRKLGLLLGERMARVGFSGSPSSISWESESGSGASVSKVLEAFPGMSRTGSDPSAVIPVPTTRTRRRRRGYNQAAVLAEAVGRALGRPVVHALERRAGAATQVALQPLERRRNVLRAFSLREEEARRIRGRHVLLVDDVLTTGATAGAASRALQGAGVAAVTLLTFARALPFRDG